MTMTTQQMKNELKDLYKAKQTAKINKYGQKLDGMNTCQVQQEYDIVVLGKKYVPPKKKKAFKQNYGREDKKVYNSVRNAEEL